MKLTVERSHLLSALEAPARLIKSSVIEIVKTVKLTAGDALTVVGSDLDAIVTQKIDASIETPGVICVNARALKGFVASLSEGGQVSLACDRATLLVSSGRANAKFPTLPPEDFPVRPETDWKTEFILDGAWLSSALKYVMPAMSNEISRPYLCGVCLHIIDGKFRAAATDGHIGGYVETEPPLGTAGMPEIILPREYVPEIARLAENGEVLCRFDSHRASFEAGNANIAVKLIDGDFPSGMFNNILANEVRASFTVETTELKRALEAVGAAIEASPRAENALAFICKNGVLSITTDIRMTTQAEVDITSDYEGPTLVFGIVHANMKTISALCGETTRIDITAENPLNARGGATPALIGTEGLNDCRYMTVHCIVSHSEERQAA